MIFFVQDLHCLKLHDVYVNTYVSSKMPRGSKGKEPRTKVAWTTYVQRSFE